MTRIKLNTKNIAKNLVWVAILSFSLSSCEEYLDEQPKNELSGEQVYRNVYDADAAVLGIYGKFMALAEKYVLLNEMRADLMTTTSNSTPYLKELSEQNVSEGNPYANPKDFYVVIQNCNDALKNFDIMLAGKKFTQGQYDQRYADVTCIRSWVYLQLGIQYGTVPYITEPIETLEDVRNINKYPKLDFNQLLDKLIEATERLNYKKDYDATSSLVVTVDGYSTAKFFINKECLLGDLHLWKGNYLEAAQYYKNVMETGSPTNNLDMYRVKFAEVVTHEDLAIYYLRNSEMDATTLVDSNTQGWRSIFGRQRDVLWNTEWIWSLPFDSDFAPKNPFIDIFSKSRGKYLAQPSKRAIALWKSNTQSNGFPYDARGEKFSYKMVGGDPVIMKYIYKYEEVAPTNVFKTDGDWFLYRAAKLHLRYAEAANRDNQHRIANALLNYGIKDAYTPAGYNSTTGDATNIQQTKKPYPYNFDARQGDFPTYRAPWHRNAGLRGRAYLQRAAVVGVDSLTSIEDNIMNEAALELAYEGNRWEDLVRISKRRNNPAYLADRIYEKLNREGNPHAAEVREKLMSEKNWYLPFTWK